MRVSKLKEGNIWAFHENLILMRDGSVFAVYQISSIVANTMSEAGKEEAKDISSSTIASLYPYVDFEINDIPVPRDLVFIMEKMFEKLDSDSVYVELANTIFNKMLKGIYETTGQPFEYQHYLIVPLKSLHISVDMKEVIRQSYRHVKDMFLQGFGIQEDVADDWYEKYHEQRQSLEKELNLLDARRLTTQQTILLSKLQYLRGMSYDKDVEVLKVESSVQNLDDVDILIENVNVLKLSNGESSSYVGFYPIEQLPTNVSYLHLMEQLHLLNFPVESKVKVKFPSTKGYFSLLGQTKRAQDKIKNAVEESEQSGDTAKKKQLLDHYLLNDLEERVHDGEKMVSYLHVLIVTADSIDELFLRRNVLMSTLKAIGVGVLEAKADQLYLFYKTMIGETLTIFDRNFIQKISVKGFAENLFFVSQKVGTDVGFYFGRVDNQIESWFGRFEEALASSVNFVFTNVLEANKQNVDGKITNNPHIAVTGDTGSGKSFLLKLLFLLHSLLRTKTLYIDPKDEIRPQFLKVADKLEQAGEYPELVAYIRSINYVSLDPKGEGNKGMLDPIVFLDRAEGKGLGLTMIKTLIPKLSHKQEKAFIGAMNEIYDEVELGHQRGMLHVFERMMKSDVEAVSDLGELLFEKSIDSVLSVAFSYGEHRGIDTTSKITVVGIKNLELPDEDSKLEITDEERNGLVILYALGYFCKSFGSADKTEETLMVLDELWKFSSTPPGKKIVNQIKRLGRSENNFLLVGTQSVLDTESDGDETGFGTIFAFNEKDKSERVLNYLKVGIRKGTLDWLKNMTMAQCVYYDTFGRMERITVDGTYFPPMVEMFDTVEVKNKIEEKSWR